MYRVLALMCLIAIANCQFFGGLQPIGGGGFHQFAGYGGSYQIPNNKFSAWGSLTQNRAPRFNTPITINAGADWKASRGGLSASGSLTPGRGGSVNLAGNADIYKVPAFAVNAFGSHTSNFGAPRGAFSSSSTAGLDIKGTNGASLGGSITHIPGIPNMGNIHGNLPLFKSKKGNTEVDLNAGVNLGGGHKPEPNVGLTISTDI